MELGSKLRGPRAKYAGCRRLRDRVKAAGAPPAGAIVLDDSSCPPGHNTPIPLRRSPPASFKRMLGRDHRETRQLEPARSAHTHNPPSLIPDRKPPCKRATAQLDRFRNSDDVLVRRGLSGEAVA